MCYSEVGRLTWHFQSGKKIEHLYYVMKMILQCFEKINVLKRIFRRWTLVRRKITKKETMVDICIQYWQTYLTSHSKLTFTIHITYCAKKSGIHLTTIRVSESEIQRQHNASYLCRRVDNKNRFYCSYINNKTRKSTVFPNVALNCNAHSITTTDFTPIKLYRIESQTTQQHILRVCCSALAEDVLLLTGSLIAGSYVTVLLFHKEFCIGLCCWFAKLIRFNREIKDFEYLLVSVCRKEWISFVDFCS